MIRNLLETDATDAIAALGVVLLAGGIGIRLGADIAIAVVGALLLVYAVLVALTEVKS